MIHKQLYGGLGNATKLYARKESRKVCCDEDIIISNRMYNFLIGVIIIYGLLVNLVMIKFLTPFFININIGALIGCYVALSFAGVTISWKSKNPWLSFLGYNMVVVPFGLVLSTGLYGVSGNVIFHVCVVTVTIVAFMLTAATIFPEKFTDVRLGVVLFLSLFGVVAVRLLCLVFGFQLPILAWISATVFSLYIAYDWAIAQNYVKTVDNAVDSALDIYMDIVLLFLELLKIFGKDEE